MLSIFSLLAVAATAHAQVNNADLVAKLLTANTQATRIQDIVNDTAFVFDFIHAQPAINNGGFAVAANSANFPALLTGNGAMTVGVLGPCGANSPHTHPRATEIQIITQGGPVQTSFIMENGARTVQNIVPIGSATLFPKGSIHFQQNLACEPTVFVASFDFFDPGTSQIAQSLFALDQGVVNATLGDIGVNIFEHLSLPPNLILGAQSCLDRCGIDRNTFNFTSSFKDFVAFSNSSWGMPATAISGPPGNSSKVRGAASNLAVDVPFSQNPLRATVIGLGTVVAALALAVIGLLVLMAMRRRSGVKVGTRFPSGTSGQPYTYGTPYDEAESLRRSTDKQ